VPNVFELTLLLHGLRKTRVAVVGLVIIIGVGLTVVEVVEGTELVEVEEGVGMVVENDEVEGTVKARVVAVNGEVGMAVAGMAHVRVVVSIEKFWFFYDYAISFSRLFRRLIFPKSFLPLIP
jgi:hypothetical protein